MNRNQKDEYISKDVLVRICTTNGGDSIVKLLEEYDPTRIGVYVEFSYADGSTSEYYMPAYRIKSIQVSNTYWTPALTEREIEEILAKRDAIRRASRWAA